MADGQQGTAGALFKLGASRQVALSNELARVQQQETIRRQDVNSLSGFDVSAIEGDQQRQVFEDALADVQSYIMGAGEYEGADYDPVNFRAQINKVKQLYEGFKAHNAGDVATARTQIQTDAYTEGGTEVPGESGIGSRTMTNNTPTSYDDAVNNHNNYFELYKVDGKVQYDANGHPMGYPIVDGAIDDSNGPTSIFKMESYANPLNFKGETVQVPMDTTLDLVQTTTQINTLNQIKQSLDPTSTEGKTDREVHEMAVTGLFNDKYERPGKSDFRETLLVDVMAEQGEILTPDEQQAFINGEFEGINAEVLKGLRKDAERIYGDHSYQLPPPAEIEDSIYSGTRQRSITDDAGEVTGEYQVNTFEPISMENSQFGPEGGAYSIVGTGVNANGERVALITEEVTTIDSVTEEEVTTKKTREVVISRNAEGQGREIYDTLMQQNPQFISDLEGRAREVGLQREEELRIEQEEKAEAIKKLMQENEGMTEAKAAEVYAAGGIEAYERAQSVESDEVNEALSLIQTNTPADLGMDEDQFNAAQENLTNTELYNASTAQAAGMTFDPNVPQGRFTVADVQAMELRREEAKRGRSKEKVEGDQDGDGQVGLKEGDEGYVPWGEPGHGYNKYETIDPYDGETVKGYEAYWLLHAKGSPGFTEPKKFRKRREFDEARRKKLEEQKKITSAPHEVPGGATEDAEVAVEGRVEAPPGAPSEAAIELLGDTAQNEGYSPELQINVPDSTNSGVTIAGLDIGATAGNPSGKMEILQLFLPPEDMVALESLTGLVGSEAAEELKRIQEEQGLLTNESMGLTQDNLNNITALHMDALLPPLYRAVGGEEAFRSLPIEVQRGITDIEFMTPGPVMLESLKVAIASGKKEDWEKVLNNYRNYYGGPEALEAKMKAGDVKSSNVRRTNATGDLIEEYIKTLV